jgi:hypothetical protein
MVKKVARISSFILRHLIASLISVVTPVIILTISYFGLLLIAMITNRDLGGPIALPFWAVFIFIISSIYTGILLFPSVLFSEIISRGFGKWQHLVQIPISTLVLAILTFVIFLLVRSYPKYSEISILHWANYPFVFFLSLLIPLGLYWWTMKIIQAGVSFPFFLSNKIRKSSN